MSESTIAAGRVFMIAFVPLMIMLPMIIALAVPSRAPSDAAAPFPRGKLLALLISTVLALALWAACALMESRFMWAHWAVRFGWIAWFPLWFGLAWPVVRAKNPLWEASMHGLAPSAGTTRTASLVNRERRSPVQRWMWLVALLACVAGPVIIGLRAFWLFPMRQGDGANGFAESADHLLWLMFLVLSGLAPLELLWLPRIIRAMLTEPEPMDAAGSVELADLYARQRQRRVLGMFWLLGVAGPLVMSSIYALVVWFPGVGGMWGLIGGGMGALLGVAGAIFGFMMTAERAKIAEVRARLDAPDASAAG